MTKFYNMTMLICGKTQVIQPTLSYDFKFKEIFGTSVEEKTWSLRLEKGFGNDEYPDYVDSYVINLRELFEVNETEPKI